MMEPSNLDLQHHELHGSSPQPSQCFHLLDPSHPWTQGPQLDGGSSRSLIQGIHGVPPQTNCTPMVHDLGFHWGSSSGQPSLHHIKWEDCLLLHDPNVHQINALPPNPNNNLPTMDFLAHSRYPIPFPHPSEYSMPWLREATLPYCLGLFQELPQVPSTSFTKASALVDGGMEARRSSTMLEHKGGKKLRQESGSSFSTFKVRKEKLGDRIAALQQLVAPFGKTDTASVLMEAIGYIKFLQDQIEALSVPYMMASEKKKLRTLHGGAVEEGKEAKVDLRSRGLCLVPLSCTSYLTNENGRVWMP